MPDTPPSPADSDATVPDVLVAFQMLRAAQDAETRALESLLLHQIDSRGAEFSTVETALDRAIDQHRAASEELTALREFRTPSNDEGP